jgi:hypothetical protein
MQSSPRYAVSARWRTGGSALKVDRDADPAARLAAVRQLAASQPPSIAYHTGRRATFARLAVFPREHVGMQWRPMALDVASEHVRATKSRTSLGATRLAPLKSDVSRSAWSRKGNGPTNP